MGRVGRSESNVGDDIICSFISPAVSHIVSVLATAGRGSGIVRMPSRR